MYVCVSLSIYIYIYRYVCAYILPSYILYIYVYIYIYMFIVMYIVVCIVEYMYLGALLVSLFAKFVMFRDYPHLYAKVAWPCLGGACLLSAGHAWI